MSEKETDPAEEAAHVAAAAAGEKLAVETFEDWGPVKPLIAINAIGNMVETVFRALPMCDHHRLEEFDNWCAYTRVRLVAEQQGEGETRQ